MKKIAIYGVGGLGHEVAAAIRNGWIRDSVNWEIIGYFDDRDFSANPSDRLCGDWLGGIDQLNDWEEPIGVLLCFGNPRTRLAVADKIKNPLVDFPNSIASNFRISDPESFSIGKGNIIQGDCKVTTNVLIGDFNLFNGNVVLGHDTTVGNGNVFMPGCKISGDVRLGDSNLFGTMSFVMQGLKIGSEITLSPLSALLTKPRNGSTYIGNPAKIFKSF
ncbi:MAG: serine acetyltransferase [Bacteroidales bacterium]|nr:serine acetyltransferase [Bacteroidales bacterium]